MLLFTVNILPEPQKQTRFVMRGKYPQAYNPSQAYIKHIQWQLKAYAPEEPIYSSVELTLNFYLPMPKATSNRMRQQMLNGKVMHIKRPDIDNLAYAVTNAGKGILYDDDSQIVRLICQKMYSDNPRIVIKVRDLADTIFNFNLGEIC